MGDKFVDKLVDKLSAILTDKELLLATAESCTGGMISSAIIAYEGASKFFDRGFVTYSNDAKREMLGVSDNILRHYGAVSPQCAVAMALGALDKSNADISVSVTGIAGPSGGSEDKPVGLVYIAIAILGKEPQEHEFNFTGSRNEVRKAACQAALELLVEDASTI